MREKDATYSQYAALYITRLDDLTRVSASIYRGEYATNLKYDSIPLFPDKEHRGLAFGVKHAIAGTYNMLSSMGLEAEARLIIRSKSVNIKHNDQY